MHLERESIERFYQLPKRGIDVEMKQRRERERERDGGVLERESAE